MKYHELIYYKDYLRYFLKQQRPRVQEKIIQTLAIIEELKHIPSNYLKHIENTDGLYEIRIQFASDIFRIFCFFDTGRLVVLLSGFQKKTQKTPKREIEKALKLMKEYYNEQYKGEQL